MQKLLSQITRAEWVKYQWNEDIPTMGDGTPEDDRLFIRGKLRTPEEAYEAKGMWDETSEERCTND
jgi:hypothetical protein